MLTTGTTGWPRAPVSPPGLQGGSTARLRRFPGGGQVDLASAILLARSHYGKIMDLLELDNRASSGMEAIIAGVSPEHWEATTPCPDWTVRELVIHVVAGNVKYERIAAGEDWRPGVPDVDLGDCPAVKYRKTVDAMLDAWRRPGALERNIELPRGRGKAEIALWIHLGETLVHGWDLGSSLGQRPVFDDHVVEASLAAYKSWLPPTRPDAGFFADATAVADDAEPIDRLAAYLGRDISAPVRGHSRSPKGMSDDR